MKRLLAISLALLLTAPVFGQGGSHQQTISVRHRAGGGGGGGGDSKWVTFVRARATQNGNQSFSGDLGGSVAKAAIVWTNQDSVGTAPAREGAGWSIGVTDCVNVENFHGNTRDNVDTPDANYRIESDTLVYIVNDVSAFSPTDPSDYEGKGTLSSCDADGITINWTDAPRDVWVHALIFAGVDSAEVGIFNPNATQDASTDVTIGDSAHFALVISPRASSTPANGNDFSMAIGMYAVDGGTPRQGAGAIYYEAVGSGDIGSAGGLDTTRIAIDMTNRSTSYTIEASVISTGIRFTTRDAAGVATEPYIYLAMDLNTAGGQAAYVDWFPISESTGAQAIADAPWQPEGGLFYTSPDTAVVRFAPAQDSTMEAFSLGAYVTSGGVIGAGTDDNTGDPGQQQSWNWSRENSLLYGYWPSRPDSLRASFTSWDANGFTINVDNAPAKQRYVLYAVFEDQ